MADDEEVVAKMTRYDVVEWFLRHKTNIVDITYVMNEVKKRA
jgi:hypothetical protein